MISLLGSGPHSGTGSAAGATSACVAAASPAAGRRGKWRGRGRWRLLHPVIHITLDGGDRRLGVGWTEGAATYQIGRARHHQAEVGRVGAAEIARPRVGEGVIQRLAPI